MNELEFKIKTKILNELYNNTLYILDNSIFCTKFSINMNRPTIITLYNGLKLQYNIDDNLYRFLQDIMNRENEIKEEIIFFKTLEEILNEA